GRDRIRTMLDRLVSYAITMSAQQIEGYKPRWDKTPNFARTPGGFTADDAANLFRSMFTDS
ncbi:MAG TPA: hypothetical protein DEP23_05330, partial [Ruminococcaceae bacterium]|nr:hypothetical protein [Oscillospiraceae bacterium]